MKHLGYSFVTKKQGKVLRGTHVYASYKHGFKVRRMHLYKLNPIIPKIKSTGLNIDSHQALRCKFDANVLGQVARKNPRLKHD